MRRRLGRDEQRRARSRRWSRPRRAAGPPRARGRSGRPGWRPSYDGGGRRPCSPSARIRCAVRAASGRAPSRCSSAEARVQGLGVVGLRQRRDAASHGQPSSCPEAGGVAASRRRSSRRTAPPSQVRRADPPARTDHQPSSPIAHCWSSRTASSRVSATTSRIWSGRAGVPGGLGPTGGDRPEPLQVTRRAGPRPRPRRAARSAPARPAARAPWPATVSAPMREIGSVPVEELLGQLRARESQSPCSRAIRASQLMA